MSYNYYVGYLKNRIEIIRELSGKTESERVTLLKPLEIYEEGRWEHIIPYFYSISDYRRILEHYDLLLEEIEVIKRKDLNKYKMISELKS